MRTTVEILPPTILNAKPLFTCGNQTQGRLRTIQRAVAGNMSLLPSHGIPASAPLRSSTMISGDRPVEWLLVQDLRTYSSSGIMCR